MVFATGSGEKANTATEIMNRHGAVELEEISAPAAGTPNFGPRRVDSGPRTLCPNWASPLSRLGCPHVCVVAILAKQHRRARTPGVLEQKLCLCAHKFP